jgi:hypothetical protein
VKCGRWTAPRGERTACPHPDAGRGERHGLTIVDEAIRQAATLSSTYILNDQLPAKAVKVLRQACEDLAFDRASAGPDSAPATVTTDLVLRAVANATSNVGQRMISEMVPEGRPLDEVAVRMKEALSQIRQT